MEVIFRKANYDDVEPIITLCNECFNENTSLKYAQENFKKTENDQNQIYIVGLANGKVIAHAKITIIPTMYEDMNTYAILNHVCVKPELRREHIGTKMLDECFKIAKENGCKCVELWSKNFRAAAHGLYHHYGFSVMDAKFFTKDVKENEYGN